jgi:hypothetical protein
MKDAANPRFSTKVLTPAAGVGLFWGGGGANIN